MATTVKNNVVRMTADNDTYAPGGKIRVRGVRLVAGIDAATAQLKATSTSGDILISMKAPANTVDDSQIAWVCDSGTLWLDCTGTSPEVYIYLE